MPNIYKLAPGEEENYLLWKDRNFPTESGDMREQYAFDKFKDDTEKIRAIKPNTFDTRGEDPDLRFEGKLEGGPRKTAALSRKVEQTEPEQGAAQGFDELSPQTGGPLSPAEQALQDIEARNKARGTFGSQFVEGFAKEGTLGYRGEDAPVDMPLSGEWGRTAGRFAGMVPVMEAGGSALKAAGMGEGLLREMAFALPYGFAEKPEGAVDDIYTRMKNAGETAAGFAVGWGAMRGIGKLFKRIARDPLEELLAKAREEGGGAEAQRLLSDQRFNMPDQSPPPPDYVDAEWEDVPPHISGLLEDPRFNMPNEANPDNIKRIADQRFNLPDETIQGPPGPPPGGPPGQEPLNPARLAAPFATDARSVPGSSDFIPSDFSPEEMDRLLKRKFSGMELSPGGPKVPPQPEGLFGRFGLPHITAEQQQQIADSNIYEATVNSWTSKMLENITPADESLAKAAKQVVSGDVSRASANATKDAVDVAMGKVPETSNPAIEAVTPTIEARATLEANIERLRTKYDLPLEVVQAMSRVAEPINYLMSKGMNFNDAAEFVDAIVKRARMKFDPANIVKEVNKGPFKPLAELLKVPEWDEVRQTAYTPEEIDKLFYNLPIKGPRAMELDMVEMSNKTGGLHLTELGYSMVKEYNPEGLAGVFPDYIPRDLLGAARGKGFSDINLSGKQVLQGLAVEPEKALESGLVRKTVKAGRELKGQYQLEPKGAEMLSSGEGGYHSKNIYAYVTPEEIQKALMSPRGLEALAKEAEANAGILRDLIENPTKMGKKC